LAIFNTSSEKESNIFSEWLEKLQQESWQLELLISGFVLLGLAQSHDYIEHLVQTYENAQLHSGYGREVFGISLFLLKYAWRIFFINLLIHVVLRGLWIGTIGLRYVSGDIDYDTLNYSDTFLNYFKRKIGSFDDYIEKLERLSSIIFAYTFLLFFVILSFTIFAIWTILLGQLMDWLMDKFDSEIVEFGLGFIMVFYIIFGLFVFFDFLTLGGLKRIKGGFFPKIYLLIYRFYSKITLSTIYRPIIYNFIDDKYTKKFFILSIPYFLLVTVLFDGFKINSFGFLPKPSLTQTSDYIINKYYDDLRENENKKLSKLISSSRIDDISLESIDVKTESLNLFVTFSNRNDGRLLKKYFDITPYRKEGIRHSLMGNPKVDSNYIKDIEEKRDNELITFFRNYKKNHDTKDSLQWVDEQRELEDKWKEKSKEYLLEKRKRIKSRLTSLFTFKIDSIDYTSKASFKYGNHRNRNEEGFFVRIFFDTLSIGEHVLEFERKYYNSNYYWAVEGAKDSIEINEINVDSFNYTNHFIPFYKY